MPNLKQYPVKTHVKVTKTLIVTFVKYQLIQWCQCLYNSPVLLRQNSGTWDYHFLHNLGIINQIEDGLQQA